MNHDRAETNRERRNRAEDEAVRRQVVRFKVVRGTTRPDPDDPDNPDADIPTLVFICHIWDGENEGTLDIPILLSSPAIPGEELYAMRPDGGTSETNPETADPPDDITTEKKVVWREIFVLERRYWIEITSYSEITDVTNRWRYAWARRQLVRNGSWKAPDTAESSGTTGIYAYNSVEANNSDTGWQGNTANLDALPPSVNVAPVQGNPIVKAWVEVNCDGDPEMIFSYENAITNVCPDTE